MKKNLLICLFLLSASQLYGQDKVLISPVEVIDTARLNKIAGLAAKEERSLKKVVRLMEDSCKTELERVYTIYTYIAGYYKYDLNRLKLIYKREIKRELYLSEVIKKKKGVCGDFSNLFAALCDSLDIGCYRVSGYSRNFNLFHPVRKNDYNHSWNAVRVDGNWYLLDVTFGMQHFTKKKFDKDRIDYEFLFTDPITFGIRHLPADPVFQLVTRQRSYTDFRYHHFLWRISNTPGTPPGDSILNKRLEKDWKDQLLEEAFAAQEYNTKVKGAGLKLLEVRINKVLDKKTKRKQVLKKQDYRDAIYLYQGLRQNLLENKGKRKYLRYTEYRILKLEQECDKLKK